MKAIFSNRLTKSILYFALLALNLFPFTSSAQFQDDFADANWQNRWQGNVEKFIVNSANELQLMDTSATSPAQLFTSFPMRASTEWTFLVRLNFSPSTANFAKLYLASTTNDFGNTNGYFLKVGGISGSTDALEIYRQDGNASQLILSGTTGTVGGATVLARIKITRDATGNWTLASDYTGGNNFQTEANAQDNTYPVGSFFGLECIYTSTRSDKFFFDDFNINTSQDLTPPQLVNVSAISANEIILAFDEALSETEASNISNYSLTPFVPITNATLTLPNEVLLEVMPALTNFQTYTLQIQGIKDISGNVLLTTNFSFSYVDITPTANSYDIIINEIMADPAPALGLPETEYIELYNRSEQAFDLQNIILASPTKNITLPSYLLLPDTYVLLYKKGTADFSRISNQIALDEFITLTNTGGELFLTTLDEEVIDAVKYSDEWYQDSQKSDGGWSLERINPSVPCDISGSNWSASENGNGGTPGKPNSVVDAIPDETFTGLVRIFPLDSLNIRLFFQEAIDKTSATMVSNYTINGLVVKSAIPETPYFNTVLLQLEMPASPSVLYSLTLSKEYADCQGNNIENGRSGTFALPDVVSFNDLVINEVLFNPSSGGVDFVEIYNRSQKILNAADLIIATRVGGNLSDAAPIVQDFLLFPDDYLVITTSPEDIVSRYEVTTPNAILRNDLPSLDDKAGTVVVYRPSDTAELIIDEFAYTSELHNALLDDENGVSLERINPNEPTQVASNWQSAAAVVGFATPTYLNSQFLEGTATSNSNFAVAVPTISPDGDGFQDFLTIDYQLEEAGFLANVSVFDAAGQLVKTLASSEVLALNGQLKWDGDLEDGTKAQMGIYILFVEYFSPNAKVQSFQTPIVVAKRLE